MPALGLVLFTACAFFIAASQGSTSPHPLQQSLFRLLSPASCVLWLSDAGAAGCSQGAAATDGALRYFPPADASKFIQELADPSAAAAPWAVIIEPSMFASPAIIEALLKSSNVAGLALAYSAVAPAAFSPASKYSERSCSNQHFDWNPNGLDLMRSAFNYTVVQLNASETSILLELAHANEARGVFDGCGNCARNILQFRYDMSSFGSTATSCLESSTCQPIGGFSPWASFGTGSEFVVLTTAFDSSALFQDLSQGSLSSSAGVAVVLAIAEAFAAVADSMKEKSLIVLLAQADSWSHSGSARWWSTVNASSCPVSEREFVKLTNGEIYQVCKSPYRMHPQSYEHLNRGAVSSVIEVQQLGLFSQQEWFLHVGCTPSAELALAAKHLASAANLSLVSGRPLPPSSVRDVFRSKNAAYLSSVQNSFVISSFEHVYRSAFFHSEYDSTNLISNDSLCSAVKAVVKATSHLLGVSTPASDICARALRIFNALSGDVPEEYKPFTCRSSKACSSLSGSYAGVFQPLSINSRTWFAYSLLSAWSSKLDLQAPSCRSDAECVAFSVNSTCILSRCRHHSAFLADAFSPSVTCQYQPKSGACKFQISRTDADAWPVWAESNWASGFGLAAFVVENNATEIWVFFSGVALTLAAHAATEYFNRLFDRFKQR